ncbi:alkaline phosphatase family protein [Corallincola spongiicola]|uniref:Alkaline phosphatase family protein n=1 Tax=Corallincola spongiicola TaxID=2520508 RepID=A0ABY1WRY9_9GAMM|nr:nucleotide pyrophosphatase/phosphodiesterase family protein [Corallincola spongiicola]TAA47502.1 alkaline phosphatase family protein [Corallincola spongiicola]
MSQQKSLTIINIVGLTQSLLGKHTPQLNKLIADGFCCPLGEVFPAVTTTAQASMLTGRQPNQHGIVGNGWYMRDLAEVAFWKQCNQLVQGDKVWDTLKANNSAATISQLFWWYNMYAKVDYSITPRPHYPADGRKIPDLYSSPAGLHESLEQQLGKFPFFNFWGPKSDIRSSAWIANAAKLEFDMHRPTLQTVYLPHLDYNMQKLGPKHPEIWRDIEAIDQVAGDLIDHIKAGGGEVMVVSEYGIEQVSKPVHLNRILRQQGYLKIRPSMGWELLDAGASDAFAVADHQIAHIYVSQPKDVAHIQKVLMTIPGVAQVLNREQQQALHIDHERSGELIAIAEPDAWFTYYYWLDDTLAPDFARTVDIHRKPGYDPVELFVDPKLRLPIAKIAWRVLQKKLGFRMLMDVIPLDASLVKGSHGRLASTPESGALLIAPKQMAADSYGMTDIRQLIQQYLY